MRQWVTVSPIRVKSVLVIRDFMYSGVTRSAGDAASNSSSFSFVIKSIAISYKPSIIARADEAIAVCSMAQAIFRLVGQQKKPVGVRMCRETEQGALSEALLFYVDSLPMS